MSERAPYERPPYPATFEEDEIDLYELWLTIKKWKNVIFITILTFLCLSIIYLLITPKIYKINFSIKGNLKKVSSISGTYLHDDFSDITYSIQKGINDLKTLIKERRFKELKKILNLDNTETIKAINARIPRDQKDVVEITIETTDPQTLPKLQKAIISYSTRLPSIQEILRENQEQLTQEVKSLEKQITAIKKLKNDLIQKQKLSGEDLKSIVEIELLIKNLEEEYISKKTELKNLKPFLPIVTNIYPTKPYKPKKLLIIAVSLTSGLFTGIFLAFFLEWLEKVRERAEKR